MHVVHASGMKGRISTRIRTRIQALLMYTLDAAVTAELTVMQVMHAKVMCVRIQTRIQVQVPYMHAVYLADTTVQPRRIQGRIQVMKLHALYAALLAG